MESFEDDNEGPGSPNIHKTLLMLISSYATVGLQALGPTATPSTLSLFMNIAVCLAQIEKEETTRWIAETAGCIMTEESDPIRVRNMKRKRQNKLDGFTGKSRASWLNRLCGWQMSMRTIWYLGINPTLAHLTLSAFLCHPRDDTQQSTPYECSPISQGILASQARVLTCTISTQIWRTNI